MHRFQYFPSPALYPYIDRYWGLESGPGEVVLLPTVLPGTGAEVYFHYQTPFLRRADHGGVDHLPGAHLLCLRQSQVHLADTAQVGFIAIRFRSGMLNRFTRLPGSAVADQLIPVDELWGAGGRILAARISEATSAVQRVRLLEDFLLAQLPQAGPDPLIEAAASRLYTHCADLPIEALASRFGLGRRQFERRFANYVGTSPVAFRSLSRFHQAVRHLLLQPAAGCLDTVLRYGYYDQSHFNRDFRRLAAAAPQRHLAAARLKTHFYNTSRPAPGSMAAPQYPSGALPCFRSSSS